MAPSAAPAAAMGGVTTGGTAVIDGSTLVVGGVASIAAVPSATVEDDGSLPGPGSPRYGIDVCECSAVSDATAS